MISSFLVLMVWVFLFLPVFFCLGDLFIQKSSSDRLSNGILSLAAGIVIFIMHIALIGSLNQLHKLPIFLFLGGSLFVLRKRVGGYFAWIRELWKFLFQINPVNKSSAISRIISLMFAVSFVVVIFLCFVPETANDALCYQLNIPKYFIWNKSVFPIQYDANSYMPMAINYLYAVGLLFKSVTLSKLFHAFLGFFLAIYIATVLKNETKNREIGIFFGLMFWLMPAVTNEAATTYVDVAVSFFVFLSLWLLIEAKRGPSTSSFRLFMSGLLSGLAIAGKISLVVVLAPLGVVYLYFVFLSKHKKNIVRETCVFLSGCLLISGYWFLRNYALTGNPLFPYFGEIFQTIGFDNYQNYLNVGIPKNVINFFLLPWHFSASLELFGRGHWLGPFILISYPFFVLSAGKKEARPYLIFSISFIIVWFMTSQVVRYVLPAIPAWFVASGIGMAYAWEKISFNKLRVVLNSFAIFISVFLFSVFIYHYRYDFLFLTGRWNYDQYLTSMERSYPVAKWINANLPERAKIFNAEEIREFYFERRTVREANFNFFTDYSKNRSPEEIIRFLKAEGFTHVLRVKNIENPTAAERLTWLDLAEKNALLLKHIIGVTSQNIREDKYQYLLYEIGN